MVLRSRYELAISKQAAPIALDETASSIANQLTLLVSKLIGWLVKAS